jgi:hypothetical protein
LQAPLDSWCIMPLGDILLVVRWKREGKAAPLAQTGAFHLDLATHDLRQRLGNRQTNASSP